MHKVVELFYSIQSEGKYAGRAATFVRLFGCNLACQFSADRKCDEPLHIDSKAIRQMSDETILDCLGKASLVVITGGEPSLNDLNPLIQKMRRAGKVVAVETNGYKLSNIASADHITYSPKIAFDPKAPYLTKGFHELKLLAGRNNPVDQEMWKEEVLKFVQPIGLEKGWDLDNVRYCHNFVCDHPEWKLSLQSHKIYGAQ